MFSKSRNPDLIFDENLTIEKLFRVSKSGPNRSLAADLVRLEPGAPPSAGCASSSGWCPVGTAWRSKCTARAGSGSWKTEWTPVRLEECLCPKDSLKLTFPLMGSGKRTCLSLTCHLKTELGPQSEWRRRKFTSLWKREDQTVWSTPALCWKSFCFLSFMFVTRPCLEDEGKVLLSEDDSGSVPANPFDIDIDHHQIGALLVRVVL